jgi:hypothetical protein
MRALRVCLMVLFVMLVGLPASHADGRGQGAVVTRDTEHQGLAPVYEEEEGEKIVAHLARGEAVAGIATFGLLMNWQFERKDNGRVHVVYFPPGQDDDESNEGWMDSKDLAEFTYECGCGVKQGKCSPYGMAGFTGVNWNPCFQEGRDKKLAELRPQWGAAEKRTDAPVAGKCTVDQILKLKEAGLSADQIKAACGE